MEYEFTRKYLNPRQKEVFDIVFRKESQENFINLCKRHLVCPECAGNLVLSIDNKYSCKLCNYVDTSEIFQNIKK